LLRALNFAPMAGEEIRRLWTALPDHAPLVLAGVGLFFYGVVWTAYAIFYRSFGLTPRQAGVQYGEIVQEAAVAVLIYALIVGVVVGGHYLVLRALRVRLPRWYKPLAVWVAVLAAVAYPWADAYLSGERAKRGEGVIVGGGSFPLPLGLPLSAPRVSVRFSEPGAAQAAALAREDCIVYLGATNETTVVWIVGDAGERGRVVQVPKRVTIVDGQTSSCDEA
jgi:hypothetical protein